MKTSQLIILAVLALISGYFLRTFTESKCPEILNSDTIYVQNVVRDTIIQKEPEPYKVVQIKYDTLLVPTTVYKLTQVPIDTALILAEFSKVRLYQDTLIDNSDVFIHLSESVRLNRLYDRQVIYEVRSTDKIVTNTIYNNGLYYGGSISTTRNFALNLAYQRNNNIFMVGGNNKELTFSYLRHF